MEIIGYLFLLLGIASWSAIYQLGMLKNWATPERPDFFRLYNRPQLYKKIVLILFQIGLACFGLAYLSYLLWNH